MIRRFATYRFASGAVLFLMLYQPISAGEFQSKATIRLAPSCLLRLEATKIRSPKKPPDGGMWGYSVFENKLYMGTGGFVPPPSILTRATLVIDGNAVALDVSGISNPWFEKPYPPYFHWATKDGLGILRAAFADGAEIYVVTWHVFKGTSLKVGMQWLGDDEIPWLKNAKSRRQQ
jgi:hypothetical protein